MDGWTVPVISSLVVIEWAAIVMVRRRSVGRAVDGSRLTFLDFLILLTALALFVSSLQYIDPSVGTSVRVVFGTLRVVLLLSGAWILWSEWRHRAGTRGW